MFAIIRNGQIMMTSDNMVSSDNWEVIKLPENFWNWKKVKSFKKLDKSEKDFETKEEFQEYLEKFDFEIILEDDEIFLKQEKENELVSLEKNLLTLNSKIVWLQSLIDNELNDDDDLITLENLQTEAKELAEKRKELKKSLK